MISLLLKVAGQPGVAALRRNIFGLVTEAVLMGVGFVLLVPLLRALFKHQLHEAWFWFAVMSGVLIGYAWVRYRTQLAGYHAAMGLGRQLFARLGDQIARLPLGWFVASRAGQLGRLTSQGVLDVMGVPAHLLRPLVTALVTPATVILLMFLFDWRLALAAVATIPVAAVVYHWSGNLVQRTDKQVDAAAVDAAGRIIEFAQAQAVLRAFSKSGSGLSQLNAALAGQHAAGRRQILTAAQGFASFVLVIQLAFTVIFLFGTNLALGGKIDAAELVALLVLAARYVEPLLGAADLSGALRISRNSLGRMDELLCTVTLPEPAQPLTPKNSSICFEHVCFTYDKKPLIKNVSFVVPERSMTAIVGPSGSGKTTLLRLIARFWDVDAGTVRVGDVDIRNIASEDLMAQISVVFQDVYLFDGSIAENIRLGREDASLEDIQQAAQLARVNEIAARLPGGLEARVGEGGAVLSGGERQRVAIARAILKDAPIILLDEATAALDPVNEVAVQAALQALTRNKTLIFVAHRLSTVIQADQILLLDEGCILEQGNHATLLAQEGRYAAFWRERNRALGWRLLPNALT